MPQNDCYSTPKYSKVHMFIEEKNQFFTATAVLMDTHLVRICCHLLPPLPPTIPQNYIKVVRD